jgi:aldehyde dehydrogenase (NAD+)
MPTTPDTTLPEVMRSFFQAGSTRSYHFRRKQLQLLKESILKHEQQLYDALYQDLKKSVEESWVTELGFVISELNAMLANLRRWMEPERVATNLLNFPSGSRIIREPLGMVLIIAPWNYPFQLLINPLVGAIAAGNCVVLKPSEFAPATEAVMKRMIEDVFPKEYVLYLEGEGQVVIPSLLQAFGFNHIFYTGSTAVGRLIYRMAAEKMVPVTLELGGKSPCVVESDADIRVAARRIAVAKFSNAGQMCVTPDYILVHDSKKEQLINELKDVIVQFFGARPEENDAYGKIINAKQFDRVAGYLIQGTIEYGGRMNREALFIEPTLLTGVSLDSPIMKDEIFGPILPIIPFSTSDQAKAVIERNPNPLAFYIFTSSSRKEREWTEAVPAGGSCINNASWHLTNHHLPFGGRGFSGTGNYHGKFSFETFSHKRAVMKTPTWFDPAIKYPPFKGKLRLFKWIVR